MGGVGGSDDSLCSASCSLHRYHARGTTRSGVRSLHGGCGSLRGRTRLATSSSCIGSVSRHRLCGKSWVCMRGSGLGLGVASCQWLCAHAACWRKGRAGHLGCCSAGRLPGRLLPQSWEDVGVLQVCWRIWCKGAQDLLPGHRREARQLVIGYGLESAALDACEDPGCSHDGLGVALLEVLLEFGIG